MKKVLLFFIIVFSYLPLKAQTPYYFYDHKGEKVYLSLNTEYAFLSVKEKQLPDFVNQLNIQASEFRYDNAVKIQYQTKGTGRFYAELSFDSAMSDEQYLQILSDISHQNEDVIVSPYFKIGDNGKIGLSNFFYVRLKEEKDTVLLKQMADQTASVIIRGASMPLWFILSVTSESSLNALELSNIFHESGLFKSAEPDLLPENLSQKANDDLNNQSKKPQPNLIQKNNLSSVDDTYFGDQWGLENTGQYGGTPGIDIKAVDAWQLSTGGGVVVAIIDEGIDKNHPDLAQNIFSYSYNAHTGTPGSALLGASGTAFAGIVGAVQNNSIGISGVAPDCKLMDISSYAAGPANPVLYREIIADGINKAWQNGADVISISWGSVAYEGTYITEAIDNAVSEGRNYLGCVVVCNSSTDYFYGAIAFPATLPNVITVGAMAPCGERLTYQSSGYLWFWDSMYGPELDVMAPGMLISSTDVLDDGGFNYSGIINDYPDRDYTNNLWNGSSATPFVSGVAALVLSANPNLYEYQVRDIIKSTAQKVGGYDYQMDPSRPDWNEEMGYGLVDAHAAVLAAQGNPPCVSDFSNRIVSTNTTVIGCSTLTVNNVTVANGIKLTIISGGEVTFTNFEVEAGAQFEVQ